MSSSLEISAPRTRYMTETVDLPLCLMFKARAPRGVQGSPSADEATSLQPSGVPVGVVCSAKVEAPVKAHGRCNSECSSNG